MALPDFCRHSDLLVMDFFRKVLHLKEKTAAIVTTEWKALCIIELIKVNLIFATEVMKYFLNHGELHSLF